MCSGRDTTQQQGGLCDVHAQASLLTPVMLTTYLGLP